MTGSQTKAANKAPNYSLAGTLAWFIVVCSSYVILLLILAGPHYYGHHIKAGDVAEQDLVSPNRAYVPDEEKTQEQAELAKRTILPALRRDAHKCADVMSQVKNSVQKMSELQKQSVLPLPGAPALSAEDQVYLLELPKEKFEQFANGLKNKLDECPIADSRLSTIYKTISANAEAQILVPKPASSKKGTGAPVKRANQKSKGNDTISGATTQAASTNSVQAWLAKIELSRAQFEILRSKSMTFDHDALLLSASLKPDEANLFYQELNSSVQKLLDNISLQPFVDKSEWELQVYEFLPERIESAVRLRAAKFVANRLETNVIIDQAATEARMKDAVTAVKPVMKEIDAGAVIVHKGETISAEEAKTLTALGITEVSDPGLATVIAISLFAAYILFGVYLYTYEAKLFFSPSSVALMATVSIVTVAVALFMPQQFPQFVPLPATALILSVIYGRKLTAILTALILLFLSVSDLLSGAHLVAVGAAAGMALGASVKRRSDLMFTSLLIGLMQMLGYTAAIIISGSPGQLAKLPSALPMEMLGGLVSSIAAIGTLPFLENIFGILTPYRIAELAEPDQPLMRQLEENAPGTYQHSLAVANLAEGGARAIGVDVNLVHTGAMYHDIGKMVTPRYFIENQLGDKNPHDFIPPEESREKVLSHVTNGLALAQKYGLPKAVQAFIPEHQGTTVIAYFYHKACQRDGAENVDPNHYRYPGPKPQTKESAIVMLADVSEAVTHSMRNPTMEEVETAISNVFKARWDDGQFNESELTIEELEKVKRGFVRVWRTLHHDRLKYPSTTTGRMPVPPSSTNKSADSNNTTGGGSASSDSATTNNTTATAGKPDQAEFYGEMQNQKPADSNTPLIIDCCSNDFEQDT